jgi:hypothetical protein
LNATYLFEDTYVRRTWPPSSESFWTAVFAMFVLHLGVGPTPRGCLTVWQCTDGSNNKWYAWRPSRPTLKLANLDFESVVVEPRAPWRPWPGTSLTLPAAAGGFSPDLVIRSRCANGREHFTIIENKVTSNGCLRDNQIENYPRLADWLLQQGLSLDILLLQSIGCCPALYEQDRLFERKPWGANFGILLWEEVFREMHRTCFTPVGIPTEAWQEYTAGLDTDCV